MTIYSIVTICTASLLFMLQVSVSKAASYILDDSRGLGRRFDGIGGLSAGVSLFEIACLVHHAGKVVRYALYIFIK